MESKTAMTKVRRYDMRYGIITDPKYSDMVTYDDYRVLEEERDATEKRIVELEAQYQQAREALEEVDNLLADYDLRFLSKTEVISALRDLKGKQP